MSPPTDPALTLLRCQRLRWFSGWPASRPMRPIAGGRTIVASDSVAVSGTLRGDESLLQPLLRSPRRSCPEASVVPAHFHRGCDLIARRRRIRQDSGDCFAFRPAGQQPVASASGQHQRGDQKDHDPHSGSLPQLLFAVGPLSYEGRAQRGSANWNNRRARNLVNRVGPQSAQGSQNSNGLGSYPCPRSSL
jgi:hypothetical protein